MQTESVAIELLYWENMRAPAFYHCQQIKWLRKKPYNKKLMTLFWPSCNVILLCQNWLRAPAFYHQPTKKIGSKIVGKKAILEKVISLFWLSCSVILLCQNWLDMGFYWRPQHLSISLGYLKIDETQSVNLLEAISN